MENIEYLTGDEAKAIEKAFETKNRPKITPKKLPPPPRVTQMTDTPKKVEQQYPKITEKRYKCRRCGQIVTQNTNHFGPTWSVGRFNTCPNCPPWAKYSEFGGQTIWDCIDNPTDTPETPGVTENDEGASTE